MHSSGAWDQVLRFMSPLVIEDELLDRGLGAFEDALESFDPTPQRPTTASSPAPHLAAPATYLHPPPEHAIPTPVVPDYPGRNLDDEENP
jgi:hypothetical protein